MTVLRVEKGYTYGIRSGFNGGRDNGTFAVSSSVRTNVTKESLALIRDILANHGPETTEAQLTELKAALLRGQALKMETLNDKLGMLGEIDAYGYAADFRAQNAKAINAMTLQDFKRIAAAHLRPDAMQYLVVGDADTQMDPVKELGLPIKEIK
jgi:zinc protease